MCLRRQIPFLSRHEQERGNLPEELSVNHKVEIDLRREYVSQYFLRLETEWILPILEEIMKTENIWYLKDRDYDTTICLTTIAYNLMVISNIRQRGRPRKIKKVSAC